MTDGLRPRRPANAELKGHRELLGQLRIKTARAGRISVPELAEPRRMSWNQVLVAAGTLIGGWALASHPASGQRLRWRPAAFIRRSRLSP